MESRRNGPQLSSRHDDDDDDDFPPPVIWCRYFQSCIFHPCSLVPIIPVPHFPVSHFQRPRTPVDVQNSSLADSSNVATEEITSHPRTSVEMNTSSSAAPPVASEEVVTGHSAAPVELKSTDSAYSSNSATAAEATKEVVTSHPGSSVEMGSCSSTAAVEMLMSLSPKPRISGQRSRKRKTESAMNITSSPYKMSLMKKTSHTAVQKKTKSKQKIE